MSRINAKIELLDMLKLCKDSMIAAYISFAEDYDSDFTDYTLYRHYNQEDLDKFLNFINREYNSGYGGQELFGTIWCSNGIWYERGEYDGAEWWERHEYPKNIPTDINKERTAKLNRICELK